MKELTPKQEKFCAAYIETGNASEAYRRAYNAEKMKPETIHRKAKEVLSYGNVTARLEQIREGARMSAQITLEQHLNDLKVFRDAAFAEGKYGQAIEAEKARGKAAGLYKNNVDLTGSIEIFWGTDSTDADE